MRINEFISVIDTEHENHSTNRYRPAATRRPRLTLRHLNKLRKIRELKRFEKLKRDALVATMYKVPDDHKNKRGKGKK